MLILFDPFLGILLDILSFFCHLVPYVCPFIPPFENSVYCSGTQGTFKKVVCQLLSQAQINKRLQASCAGNKQL